MDEGKKQLSWTSVQMDRALWSSLCEFAWANRTSGKRVLERLVVDFLRQHGIQVEPPVVRPVGRPPKIREVAVK